MGWNHQLDKTPSWMDPNVQGKFQKKNLKVGLLFPYYSHKNPLKYGNGMGPA